MVATNEFEDAWMDEGINSYSEVKVLDSILGKKTSILNMAGAHLGEREEQRDSYIGVADRDPIAQNAYAYYNLIPMAGSPTERPPAFCSRSKASLAKIRWPRRCTRTS